MKKVFLIDDRESVSRLYFDLLHRHYKVAASIRADEVIDKARRFLPDLIIINTSLPHFDPIAFCEEIKEAMQVPVIVLMEKEDGKQIDGCRAEAVLTKPVGEEELIRCVDKVLGEQS
jgi:two-component system cell cycle response regulator DivK